MTAVHVCIFKPLSNFYWYWMITIVMSVRWLNQKVQTEERAVDVTLA